MEQNNVPPQDDEGGTVPVAEQAKRMFTLREAIEHLSGLPEYPAVDSAMRKATERLVREMESAPPPRPQAIQWLDQWCKHYVRLVRDVATLDSFRSVLMELIHPHASMLLFGAPAVVLHSRPLRELQRHLDQRVRYWLERGSAKLARAGRAKQTPRRRSGFPAAVEQHRAVLAEVERFGEQWKDHLPEICAALAGKVPLLRNVGRGYPSWAEIGEDVESASELRERVRKYIKYRIGWAKQAPKSKPSRSVAKPREVSPRAEIKKIS